VKFLLQGRILRHHTTIKTTSEFRDVGDAAEASAGMHMP